MILAKNNIIIKIKNTAAPEYVIMNPVSGSFDMMDDSDDRLLKAIEDGTPVDSDFLDYVLERGYVYQSAEDEKEAIDTAYAEFNEEIKTGETQLMLIPTYGCNLACTYCYQHGIDAEYAIITKETVDAFFDYASENFSDLPKKPFVTLFGGEPLVNSPRQREIINYIVDRCATEGYALSAVTNGNDFTAYVDILKKVKIKEIQFTLDGSREVHNARRATANKMGTFDNVIAGIDAAVKNGFPVNLRTVVDLENIKDTVNMAEYLDSKGWLDLPPDRFKTQIGRNYELFDCYFKPQHLMTQAGLWAEYSALSKEYPVLEKFHRPDFKGIRHMIDTGEMYMASFDTCPAAKTEWIFDLNGEIYGCTASCGRKEYQLGTFYPEVSLNKEAINTWKKRDVKNIEKCKSCKYDVICGGGCGVVAANKNGCDPLTPDCRPIQELLEIGVNHYIDDIRRMTDALEEAHQDSGDDNCCNATAVHDDASCCDGYNHKKPVHVKSTSCCDCTTEDEATAHVCSCGGDAHKTTGCAICGHELIYQPAATKSTCMVCGKAFEANIICPNGHYICDSCHSGDILKQIEALLDASTSCDPVVLIKKIFELPGLKMHGPEYHSIVPAVLVTAYQNLIGQRDSAEITEAIRRGKDVTGGSCGYHGGCGAALGTGIATSVIEQATPMSASERSKALEASSHALLAVSRHGGPRCCKRDALTAIESFVKNSGYLKGLVTDKYKCLQFAKNKDCIGTKCPYFPKVKLTVKGK